MLCSKGAQLHYQFSRMNICEIKFATLSAETCNLWLSGWRIRLAQTINKLTSYVPYLRWNHRHILIIIGPMGETVQRKLFLGQTPGHPGSLWVALYMTYYKNVKGQWIIGHVNVRSCLLINFNINQSACSTLDWMLDRKSTRLNSSHVKRSRMPSSAWKKKNIKIYHDTRS